MPDETDYSDLQERLKGKLEPLPSQRQLERWYDAGLLGSVTYEHGHGGRHGRGFPSGAENQAARVAQLQAANRKLADIALMAWSEGYHVRPGKVKAALKACLFGSKRARAQLHEGSPSVDEKMSLGLLRTHTPLAEAMKGMGAEKANLINAVSVMLTMGSTGKLSALDWESEDWDTESPQKLMTNTIQALDGGRSPSGDLATALGYVPALASQLFQTGLAGVGSLPALIDGITDHELATLQAGTGGTLRNMLIALDALGMLSGIRVERPLQRLAFAVVFSVSMMRAFGTLAPFEAMATSLAQAVAGSSSPA